MQSPVCVCKNVFYADWINPPSNVLLNNANIVSYAARFTNHPNTGMTLDDHVRKLPALAVLKKYSGVCNVYSGKKHETGAHMQMQTRGPTQSTMRCACSWCGLGAS